MMNLKQVFNKSNIVCEYFGYNGKNKHLPLNLKYSPQYILQDGETIKLVYFKESYDDRFIELSRNEIECVRVWNAGIHSTFIIIYNHNKKMHTIVSMNDINNKMFKASKRERIDMFLFNNNEFVWRKNCDEFKLR